MPHTLRISLLWHKFEAGKIADRPKFLATIVSIMYARQIFARIGFHLDFRPQHYAVGPIMIFDGKIDFAVADTDEKYCDRLSDRFPPIAERETRLPVLFARSRFEEEVAAVEANKAFRSYSGVCCWRTKKQRKSFVMVSDEGYGPDILAHEITHAAELFHLEKAETEYADPLNIMNEREDRTSMRTNFSPRQLTALRQSYFCNPREPKPDP